MLHEADRARQAKIALSGCSVRHRAMSNRAQFVTKYWILYYFHYNSLDIIVFLSAETLFLLRLSPKLLLQLKISFFIDLSIFFIFCKIYQRITKNNYTNSSTLSKK